MIIEFLSKAVSPRVFRDFTRHIRNFNTELDTDKGDILIAGARIRGDIELTGPDGSVSHERNLWTVQGHNHMLGVVLNQQTAVATWYVAPFSGNVTVLDTWTHGSGNNFATEATELNTQYTEGTRVAYTESAPAASSLNNTASPSIITAAQDNVTIWGAGLCSIATKLDVSAGGILLAASKYSTAQVLASTGNTLGIKWTLTLSN